MATRTYIGSCRGADSLQIQEGHQAHNDRRQQEIGNLGDKPLHREGHKNPIQERLDQVVEEHRPAGQESQVRIQPTSDIGVR